MTSELQTPRYDQIIRRAGGIIGPGSKVSEALSELFPVLDVEQLPGELLLLGGTAISEGASTVFSAAGETPRIQVFNPVASGVLLTISSAVVSVSATTTMRSATSIIALTTGVGTEVFRDRRQSAVSRPSGQIRTDSTVALTDANTLFRVLANSTVFVTDPNSLAVLPPGAGFEFGSESVASQMWVTFYWRERVGLESELNLP